jgi:hypothetical protein
MPSMVRKKIQAKLNLEELLNIHGIPKQSNDIISIKTVRVDLMRCPGPSGKTPTAMNGYVASSVEMRQRKGKKRIHRKSEQCRNLVTCKQKINGEDCGKRGIPAERLGYGAHIPGNQELFCRRSPHEYLE